MALRFFADHCVSNAIIQTLRDAGHEVLRLRDHLPIDSADGVVIERAQQLDSLLLSLNGDFADIVIYPPRKLPRDHRTPSEESSGDHSAAHGKVAGVLIIPLGDGLL